METIRRTSAFLLILVMIAIPVRGQDFFTRDVIDTPTAGILPRGSYLVGIRAYPEGGILMQLGVGLFERFELGVSFGGTNVIGEGDVEWNPGAEFFARYRLIDETIALPALAVGFDSQGWGRYLRGAKRYQIKSRGFYGVLSKNYRFLGQMGLHLGANLSLEGTDEDRNDPNVFLGLHKSINPNLWIVAEYDLPITGGALTRTLGEVVDKLDSGVGFVNVGVRFLFDENLLVELDLRNVNGNARDSDRTLRIVYHNAF